jgi:hypothetical protein
VGEVVSLSKRFQRRVMAEFTDEQHRALRAARSEDGIAVNPRLRALVAYWRAHPEIHEEIRRSALQEREDGDVA